MKLHIVVLFATLITNFSFAQKDTLQVLVDWQIGDQKEITSKAVSSIIVKDSIVSTTEVTARYTITILDTTDRYYIASSRSEKGDLTMQSTMTNLDGFFSELVKLIEDILFEADFLIGFDRETGMAQEIINTDEIYSLLHESTSTFLEKFSSEYDINKEEIEKSIDIYLNEIQNNMFTTMINGFNLIFQGYSYPFIPDETYATESEYYEANQIEYSEIKGIPATLYVSSLLTDDNVTISTRTEIDKIEMVKQMRSIGKMTDLTADDFEMILNDEYLFNLNTSWIESVSSHVEFQGKGDVRVVNTTNITIE